MISRTTQSLLGAVGLLVLAVGIAEVHPPTGQAAVTGATVLTAVQHSTLLCPPPEQGTTGHTGYSLAVPGAPTAGAVVAAGSGGAGSGSAAGAALGPFSPVGSGSTVSSGTPLVKQTQVGGSSTAKAVAGAKAPALLATADGATAPGFTVQQTTTGVGNSLSGIGCTPPGTDFWFAGADAAKSSTNYLELTNGEATGADADIQIFGPTGEVDNPQAADIEIPAGGSTSLLLSTLVIPGVTSGSLAVHVQVRSGRVAAALHADSGAKGADWIPATTSASSQMIPGLPGDLTDAVLILAAPGAADADLNVQLASQSGWITPAGHDTVHVKAGMVAAFDLANITRGQPAAMRLTPSDPKQATPFVATVEVFRGKGSTDTGYVVGGAPIGQRATAAGSAGTDSLLMLSATGTAAVVKVSSIGASGAPVTQNVSIPAGVTAQVTPKAPAGSTTFAVTVEPVSGGSVYAARMITVKVGSVPSFTIQQLADDHSTVQIPHAVQDGSVLLP